MPPVPKQHVCSVCAQRFRRLITLQLHQKVLHPWTTELDGTIIETAVQLPFQCQQCKKGFARREEYFAHKKLHTGAQAMTCGKCHKRMMVRRTESKHARVHVSAYPPYDCVCGRRFQSNQALDEHLKHRGQHVKPFLCVCGYLFRQQLNIKMKEDVKELNHLSEVGKRWSKISF